MPEFGGLIPDPQFNLNERLNKLESRIEKLEKGKAEPEPDWGELVAQTCPECGGEIKVEGKDD